MDGSKREGRQNGEDGEESEIGARPVGPKPLTDPEDAEARKHQADSKLEQEEEDCNLISASDEALLSMGLPPNMRERSGLELVPDGRNDRKHRSRKGEGWPIRGRCVPDSRPSEAKDRPTVAASHLANR